MEILRQSISIWLCILTTTLMMKIVLQEDVEDQGPRSRRQGAITSVNMMISGTSRLEIVGVPKIKAVMVVNSRTNVERESLIPQDQKMTLQRHAITSRVGRQRRRRKKEEAGHQEMNPGANGAIIREKHRRQRLVVVELKPLSSHVSLFQVLHPNRRQV